VRASVAKIEGNCVQLEVEVEAQQLDAALDKAYKKLVKKYTVPGFRKGKAPRRLLENFIGKEALLDEALDMVVPDAYMAALKETAVEPIDRPQVELVQLEEGLPLVFKATVEVKPEVELGQYTGLVLKAKAVQVTDEDVDNHIENLRRRSAKMVEVEEGGIQVGDRALIDFEGFIDGESFPGGKGEGYTLEIGSNTFIPGFEEQLVGASIDQEREINVTFPENYHKKELAGKPATFKVKILGVKRPQYAPVDDELAKDLSDFETLEELRQDVRNRLKEAGEDARRRQLQSQAIEQATDNSQVPIPKVMVERRMDRAMEDLRQRLMGQGITLERYAELVGSDLDAIRENFRSQAERQVKTDLVLEAIAKKEDITVTQEEIDQHIEKMAKAYRQTPEVMRQLLEAQDGLDFIKYGLMIDKTVDFLVDNATVQEVPDQPDDVNQQDQ